MARAGRADGPVPDQPASVITRDNTGRRGAVRWDVLAALGGLGAVPALGYGPGAVYRRGDGGERGRKRCCREWVARCAGERAGAGRRQEMGRQVRGWWFTRRVYGWGGLAALRVGGSPAAGTRQWAGTFSRATADARVISGG